MIKTNYFSWRIGELSKGCKLCVEGLKEVIFITGICNRACYFCPISDEKYQKDVIYANEWKVDNYEEIIEEAKLCDSKGAGFTGGDPLAKIDRTIELIKLLKKKFGKEFHIHLYTSLDLIDKDKLQKLHSAGLDEIRVHPDLDNNKLWDRIGLLKEFNWSVGAEIPVISGKEKQTKELIEFISGKVDFLNLNELEISDNSTQRLVDEGYTAVDELSYAVKGSHQLAMQLMRFIEAKKLIPKVHYCTAKLKDAVQLAERIKRRAKNVKEKFDEVSKEGMLIRGVIYLPELEPRFNYKQKMDNLTKDYRDKTIIKLTNIKDGLIKEFKINSELIKVDEVKLRIITSTKLLRTIARDVKKMKLTPAIVEEYPTRDSLEIEVEFL